MSRPDTTFTKKTRLFSPSFTRHLTSQGSAIKDLTSANISGSKLENFLKYCKNYTNVLFFGIKYEVGSDVYVKT